MAAAEAVIRAGMLKLGCGMLGELLLADPGYRGPRVPCGQGHEAEFVANRDKIIDTVLGVVTLTRVRYHCAACGHGLALDADMLASSDDAMRKVRGDSGAELREFNGEDDHVHLLVQYPPKIHVSGLVNSLKGAPARRPRSEFTGRANRHIMHGTSGPRPTSPHPAAVRR